MPLRATKIVATLGPASSDPDLLERMIRGGVNVVRLNFSHGKAQDHIDRANLEASLDFAEGRMKKKVLGASEALDLGVRQVVFADGRAETPLANALAGRGTVIS